MADSTPAAGKCPHRELGVVRNANLADRQRIHRQLQLVRDARRDRDAASGEWKQDGTLGGEVGVGEQLTEGRDESVARVVPIGEDRHALTLDLFLLVSAWMGQISCHAARSRGRGLMCQPARSGALGGSSPARYSFSRSCCSSSCFLIRPRPGMAPSITFSCLEASSRSRRSGATVPSVSRTGRMSRSSLCATSGNVSISSPMPYTSPRLVVQESRATIGWSFSSGCW